MRCVNLQGTSYLALVQIWEQYNYIQMRNYYTLVHIMLSCEVM